MIFARPVPFKDAVGLLQKKELMPTTAGSAELKKLSADITRRAAFSAKVTNTVFLQRAYDLIGRIVDPTAAGSAPGTYMDKATFRLELKNFLQSIGYAADEGKAGTIQDLASDGRLNLIADMNTQLSQGYGQFVQAQDAQVLDAFPAQELYRAGNFFSKLQRDWPSKWRVAGGSFYGGGRMIALKSDPIWMRSLDAGGFNRFGNPYPPFDYNSGMWVKPVSRDEAEGFGLIGRGEKIEPTKLAFAPGLQNAVGGLAKTLQEALLESLGDHASIEDGVLSVTNRIVAQNSYPQHPGRPGQVGGSLPKDAVVISSSNIGWKTGGRSMGKHAVSYAKRKLRDKRVFHPEIKEPIQIGVMGVRHTMQLHPSEEKLVSVPALPKLIRKATLIGVESDYRGRPGVSAYRLESQAIIDGKPATVEIVLRKTHSGVRFHWHRVKK